MEICKKKIKNTLLSICILFFFTNLCYSNESFKKLEEKKVSYLDFFLLKFENTISRRANVLQRQAVATRIQYSNVGIKVEFIEKKEKIFVKVYAIMDKIRYQRKKYVQKMSDCNQVRNLIFYKKHGYKFFTQKRDPNLSIEKMKSIFKEVFFENLSFNDEEMNFLMKKMFIEITILHPIIKKELSCSGKINDYELK